MESERKEKSRKGHVFQRENGSRYLIPSISLACKGVEEEVRCFPGMILNQSDCLLVPDIGGGFFARSVSTCFLKTPDLSAVLSWALLVLLACGSVPLFY